MKQGLILRWLLSAVTILIVSYIVPGLHVDSIWTALIAALVLGLVNVFIRPILLILTLPVNIVTLGLFTLVINALMLMLVSSIVRGFDVASFTAALVGAFLMWLVSVVLDSVFKAQ